MNSLKTIIDSRLSFVKQFTEKNYCRCKRCQKNWKTKLINGITEYDLSAKCECGSEQYEVTYRLEDNNFVIQVLEDLARAYKTEIHEYLVPSNLPDKETQIRNHIKDIMTKISPIVDGRISAIKKELDGIIYAKSYNRLPQHGKELISRYYEVIGLFERVNTPDKIYTKKCKDLVEQSKAIYAKYKPLYNVNGVCDRLYNLFDWYVRYSLAKDGFNAIVAFRHFETFCIYVDDCFGDKHPFSGARHLFKGFYYYANSMVLNKDVHFIEKQCFAGAGKSVTDGALMAFILGYDINSNIVKVFGNKDNIRRGMETVLKIMLSPQYANVFPYYAKFGCKKTEVFSICNPANGELQVNGCVNPTSILMRSKLESFDGIRAQYLFLDDITQSKDAEIIEKHKADIEKFDNSWFERKDNLDETFIIASGTTYHQEDFLSYLKHNFGVSYAKETPFRFTSISKWNAYGLKWLSVFVVIYGLDEYDRSTYEERFPASVFIKKRKDNPRMFYAMVQQIPQPPKGAPFDYDNLPNLYGEAGIPHLPDRSQEVCRASLDPARKGKDFHSMPVVVSINGRMFLQDCIYETCPPEHLPPKIIDMIERHHIVHLDIENNTTTDLKQLIQKLLKERGINYCQVTDFYSYIKKDDKIREYETAIKSIYFPERGVFSRNSQMGEFMYWLTAYNYETPPKHDDSVDSLANFSQRFILNKTLGVKVRSLKRR